MNDGGCLQFAQSHSVYSAIHCITLEYMHALYTSVHHDPFVLLL